MDDKIQSNRVVCEGGLDTTQNYVNLSLNKPGCATRLINYEVGLTGGYRRINGYAPYDAAFPEVGVGAATGRVLGVMIFDNSANGATEIYAARRNLAGNDYKFYKYSSGVGWVAVATGLTHHYINGGSEVEKLRYAVGNDGNKNYLAIVDGVNNALLFDGTTWAFIDSADTGAAMATAGGNQAIDAPHLVTFFSSTLFLACDLRNSKTGLASYSAPNAFYDFTSASGGGQIPAGAEIVDFKPFRESLYVFGFNVIKRIVPDTTAGFLQKDVTSNIGCISRDSVIEIGGDLLFLAPDGFRPIQGTDKIGDVQLETLSKPIHSLVQVEVASLAGTSINSVVIRGKSQFRYFFGDDSFAASDSTGIIGALRSSDQLQGWEFGQLIGFRCSCITSRYILGEEVVIHGDYDGNVYQQEVGSDLNGGNLLSVYSTTFLDLGDTEIRKVMDRLTTFMFGEGDINTQLTVAYDWDDPNVSAPSAYNLSVTAVVPLYNATTSIYNTSLYGGVVHPVVVEPIEGSFKSVKFTFTSSGMDPPHSIHAMVISYKVEGRRN